MATPAQIAANRRNAQKSTGPRTSEGKHMVGQNAVRHGLLTNNVLMPGEDAEAYERFTRQIHDEHMPATVRETLLMKRIAEIEWRLDRFAKVEAALYLQPETLVRHEAGGGITRVPLEAPPQSWEQELDALNPQASALGSGFLRSAHTFEVLQRYEAHLHRLLERSLHELERLQYARAVDALPHAVSRMKRIAVDSSPRPQHGARLAPTVGFDLRADTAAHCDANFSFERPAPPAEATSRPGLSNPRPAATAESATDPSGVGSDTGAASPFGGEPRTNRHAPHPAARKRNTAAPKLRAGGLR
jgi:hypothetical protein